MPAKDHYSTRELAEIAGITLRRLQWADEAGIVCPVIRRHSRQWTRDEALRVCLLSEFRRKGVSLGKVRKLLRQVVVAGLTPEMLLITDGRTLRIENSRAKAIEYAVKSRKPVLLVAVTDILKRLE